MKKIWIAFACLLITGITLGQVTEPQKLIKIAAHDQLIEALDLNHGTEYGFLAKDLGELFPALVKEKRVRERFGKNVYRTKVIRVIDEKALIPALVASIKKQTVPVQDLRAKILTIENKM